MSSSVPLSFHPHAGALRRWPAAAAVALLAAACTVDSEPLFQRVEPLDTSVSRPGNLPAFPAPGSSRGVTGAASDGVRGDAIAGLLGVDAGVTDGGARAPDAGDAGAECAADAECDDGNECTDDECSLGACRSSARAAGAACGSLLESECTQPDSCDGAGNCVPNDRAADTPCGRDGSSGCTADACDGAGSCVAQELPAGTPCGDDGEGCNSPTCDGAGSCEPAPEPNGSACPGGSCSLGSCVAGQPVGCPAALASDVPLQLGWSSAERPNLGQGSCDESVATPDFALVFSAPAAGDYRIEAQGSADSVLVVRAGACSDNGQLACNDDRTANNRDPRIDLSLSEGQAITIYVSEFGNGSSGAGTLQISLL